MFKFFSRIKKLMMLLKAIDTISINDETKQITLKFKNNLLLEANDSIVMRSGKHIVVKTGNKDNGLLFLNPMLEESDSVEQITEQSTQDHIKSTRKMNSMGQTDDPCSI